MGKQQVHVRLPDELYKKLKAEVTETTSLNSVIVEKLEASVATEIDAQNYLRASAASLGRYFTSNNVQADSLSGLDSVVALLSAPTTPWKGTDEEEPEEDKPDN